MKVLLAFGLVAAVLGCWGNSVTAQSSEEGAAVRQSTNRLDLSIKPSKRVYRQSEQFRMQVLLVNSGQEIIFVFGALQWGYSASLTLHVRDSSGREVEPVGFADDQTHESPNDQGVLVKLLPNHFLGTNFFAPLPILNLKPGRYSIFVKYSSPFSKADVKVNSFWSKESGTIKSNVVSIDVHR